jgi:hypothetical protein
MSDKTLTLNMSLNNFHLFISYIKELSLVDSSLIMVMDNEDFMLYSFVGSNLNDIHAFKSVITKTNEIFDNSNKISSKIIFILKDGKRFARNIQNFIDFDEDIKMKISYNDSDNNANYLSLTNSRLKIKEISGDPYTMSKEITKDDINFLTNKDNSLFDFEILESDFRKIKSMSNIDITNDILYLNIDKNELFLGENKWNLKICDIDKPNLTVSFPKKYFKNLKFKENTKMYLFENYVLISDDNSDLMIVLETSI